MAIVDVTLTLQKGLLTYPGDPPFNIEHPYSISKGDSFNLSLLSLTTHTGTHIDAPAHYLDGGLTIEFAPLDLLIGSGVVIDMRGKKAIDSKALAKSAMAHERRVFFKTDNSAKIREAVFSEDYTYITASGAEFLVERGVKLVGIDYLSVDRFDDEASPAHRVLLSSGAFIVEMLDLSDAPLGPCRVYCLPLKIFGADGAPARVLIETGTSINRDAGQE